MNLYSFESKIWNVETNGSGSKLAFEFRNEESKKVSFSIYDVNEGVWIWEHAEFEEEWWLNLEALDEEHIYINYFPDHENPESKRIIQVSIQEMVVENEFESYQGATQNKPLRVPFHYQEDSSHFNKVKKFLEQRFNERPVKAIDYLQTESVILISYYLYDEDQLTNFFLILDINGELLLEETIGNELTHVGMQTFFMVHDLIVVIKNKTELILCEL